MPPGLATVFNAFELPAVQLEAAIASASVEAAFRRDRSLNRFNAAEHRLRATRVADVYDKLLSTNAQEVCQRVTSSFKENVRLSSLPASQLANSQKEFKQAYTRGRRELEHEFGKSMRYKAIRDLASGDSGEVLKNLKPVWLMSPLSVSDTLPLDSGCFDVVIFDEASQIALEEAVPSLFRATQAIVVGDEMQLPPTTFFAAKQSDEEEELVIEEEGESISYELGSSSFLNHAARNLPATMLGWHYRSRSESLISFSNWAFYDGRLLTVPEERLPPANRPPLIAKEPSDAEQGADELIARPISFHFMKNGTYEQRRNTMEADYIASLVRRLLTSHAGRSIGVIAFSEAQQSEIDDALARLANEDADFAGLYEAELEREVDGQHVGLLVKNLENLQGDERDVIILSVCYGPDPSGKIRMNFGPINMSGGEKRLNVAFSRAKHHMAVVSSIRSNDITNDFNEGAAYFKHYLSYAEAVSEGRSDSATRVLNGLSRWHGRAEPSESARDAMADQLSVALIDRGYLVDRNVGQSHFRCDLAVRQSDDVAYRLGILIDGEAYYEQDDVLERDVMRPKLLQAFGWNVCQVFAKDWFLDRERVVERILRRLSGSTEAEAEELESVESAASDEFIESSTAHDGRIGAVELEESEQRPVALAKDAIAEPTGTSEHQSRMPDIRRVGPATRYFEYQSGSSGKFWEITLDGARYSVRFGRIGSAGQLSSKEFSDEDQTLQHSERLIHEKLSKGYREVR